MRVLVVEDDAKIASFITKGLEQAGFAVDHAADGEDGLFMATSAPYDAAVIDIMLPGRDGLSVIAAMRQAKLATPVIILSAKHSVEDRIQGLQTGSDDYLVKPFTFAELLARVQALIRRSSRVTEPNRLTVGDLSVDLITRETVRSGQPIELQPREFSLLEYLMRHSGRVVSKTMILEHIWNYHFDPQTNVVDVLVCRLRNKIDRDYEQRLIHTIRGVGYVIKDA
jgi:two-component system, OmpR family, response regulator